MTDQTETPEIGWAILELMGHRKMAGYVTGQQVGGAPFVRIDVYPGPPPEHHDVDESAAATQIYSPQAVYCITPTTQEIARRFAAGRMPQPVARWELPPPDREGLVDDAEAAEIPF